MRSSRRTGLLVTSGAILALVLMIFASPQGGGSSQAQQDAVQNCPEAGKWAISVWDGADGTDPVQALANCSEPSVAAAYWIDPQTQTWSRWFASRPEISDLTPLQHGQGLIALGTTSAHANTDARACIDAHAQAYA